MLRAGRSSTSLGGRLDAAQSLARVVREVALAQLAVVDDVDADLRLTLDDLFDGGGQACLELGLAAPPAA